MRRSFLLLGFVALTGCGGGGPSGPTPVPPTPPPVAGWPAGTALDVVAGDTGAPVPATVLVGGVPYVGSAAAPGEAVEITATGYLPRLTSVKTGITRLTLWPDSPRLPGAYTRTLVYREMGPMRRLPPSVRAVALAPSPALQGDTTAMASFREATGRLTAATGAAVTYVVGGTADLTVTTRLNPADSYCVGTTRALTYVELSAGEITSAEIVFCMAAAYANASTPTHELGHTFGLGHSPDSTDMMGVKISQRRDDFSGRERLEMALMLQRRGGNLFPDNDRGVVALSGRRVEVIVD